MSKFTVRSFETADLLRFRDLLGTRDDLDNIDPDLRLNMVSRIAFDNPVAEGEATYFVVEDKGQVVAHVGRMPALVGVAGGQLKAYFVHDLYVRPDYRKDGLGFFISMALYDATSKDSDSFCCLLWTTHLNLDIQRRFGYLEAYADGFLKVLKFEFVMRRLGLPRLLTKVVSIVPNFLLRMADGIRSKMSTSSCRIAPVDRFDIRFDRLTDRVASKLGLFFSRSSDILNWKYVDAPGRHSKSFAAFDGDEVLGYIVLEAPDCNKASKLPGLILEIVVDPDDSSTTSRLLAAAVSYFRGMGAEYIRCVATEKQLQRALRTHLFVSRKSWRVPVMLGNLDKCPDIRDVLIDTSRWHFTLGDSDGFMFGQ